jgi:tRNA nucleotidyltransferase/poly(A) polymerase
MRFISESYGKTLVKRGFWAYYAFETSRDMLLKRDPKAIKILTNADLLQISKLFPKVVYRKDCDEHAYLKGNLPVYFFISDYPEDRNVHIPGMIEKRREAGKHAAKETLFSINSFLFDFERDVFYDPLDAYPYLKQKKIKTIKKPAQIAEKFPTVALKTAKIFSETGFSVDRSLREFLKYNQSLYHYDQVNECVAEDFIDILVSGNAYKALTYLEEWGVIDTLLPEVATLKYVFQDKDHHPEGNGFWHTIECLKFVKRPKKALMMAVLLHDTGKALTQYGKEKDRSFPEHSIASKSIAKNVLKRFYFSDEEIKEVLFLVSNHMMLNSVDRLPENRLRTLFTSPYFPDLLEIYRADLESGYHNVESYYHAARVYKEFLRKERLRNEGIYA